MKSAVFDQSLRKFDLKFLKITSNIFPKFFSKKCHRFFLRFYLFFFFLGRSFLPPEKGKNMKKKKSQLTDPTSKVCPPANRDSCFNGLLAEWIFDS